ncbi:MAG: hypothetical protein IPM55_14255 [Acidobacteria bacterium]|nr:hypothetical protein [Acidobacteriota bacterium]
MGRSMIGANYVYSKTTDETDGPLSLPADNFNLRLERGFSLQDIRHRFFLMSNFTLPFGLRLSSILQYNTAPPYNITTGFGQQRRFDGQRSSGGDWQEHSAEPADGIQIPG